MNIKSFLINIFLPVVINKCVYPPELVILGVPQGSAIGPLLFRICIHDDNSQVQSNMRLFADDYVVYRSTRTPSDSFTVRNDLQKMRIWCIKRQMKINTDKTKD